ncbi:hypothetical protein PLICRDRAFT_92909 [Plicaturopsis crispa FD-325 SS-3]|nr:hypothetical protein PLICRDRAFT_92909 [Plicaturopsis crispa FD-325 SS-3]
MMKRCSGCLGSLYCSKECQRLDWALHRRSCKSQRKLLQEGLRMPRDMLDESFYGYITDHDIACRLPGIAQRAAASGVPMNTLVLECNYATVPPSFDVKHVSDYPLPPDPTAAERDWNDKLRRAEGSNGRVMATKTIVPQDEVDEELLMSLIDLEVALSER